MRACSATTATTCGSSCRPARAEVVPLPEDVLRRFVGGVGLAAYLLHRECPAGVDPLAPAAPLVFAFSPLVGTPLTTSAKFAVAAKSPLTERFNDALSSSHFAIDGKQTGFDAIVIVGRVRGAVGAGDRRRRSPARTGGRPVGADHAGGDGPARGSGSGRGSRSAVIGPAGENLVRFATISHDNRHAGRGGLGAVMGSKHLKAVGVRGTQRTPVADPAGVVAAARDLSERSFGPATAKYRELGTVANLLTFNRLNALPTRNFQQGQFEEAEAISGEALNDGAPGGAEVVRGVHHRLRTHLRWRAAGDRVATGRAWASPCVSSTNPCSRWARCAASPTATRSSGPRGCATTSGWTPSPPGRPSPSRWSASSAACSPTGLRFGDGDTACCHCSTRSPAATGSATCSPTARAARREVIGGDAPDFAPHVKGLELPGYEPRALQAMALGFAVGTRGADHNRSGAYEADFSPHADRLHGSAESARLAVETEDRAALIDSLILCKFLRGVFADIWSESRRAARQGHRLGRDRRRAADRRPPGRDGRRSCSTSARAGRRPRTRCRGGS